MAPKKMSPKPATKTAPARKPRPGKYPVPAEPAKAAVETPVPAETVKPTTRTKTAEKSTSESAPKKRSALDAAAKVLAESGEPMIAKAMIEAMATHGYWTSPGGKTPHATLYTAICREIATKKDESRFRKADKGLFAVAVSR